ncbi:MAG: methyltransferase domain-containing protein [Chloroflexota bacterium]|nr:methyltransferase domain-containing protein [Chloroflexota bacterium]
MPWDPTQYLRFGGYRTRPAIDLLARVPLSAPRRVYDLGCGPGNATQLLRERWPEARVTGVDASAEMLDKARASHPDIEWVRDDIAAWRAPEPADLIFSNAALHWLGDHARLFPALAEQLAPGGVLAVQMPDGFHDRWHTLMNAAVYESPYRERLEPLLLVDPVGPPSFYFDLLSARARDVDVWTTRYLHVLEGDDPVKEWTKGSALKPLLDALPPAEGRAFESRYAELVRDAYPRRPEGTTLFPFQRLFIVAIR